MMISEDCHRSVEAVICERQILRIGLRNRRGTDDALSNHHCRGLNRHDLAVGRFVGARARTNIDDRPRIAQGVPDHGGQPWIGLPRRDVASTDPIVERHPEILANAPFGRCTPKPAVPAILPI
jgi:hypothetical protein